MTAATPAQVGFAADTAPAADAVLLEEQIDIEIASPTSARVRYQNRTKVLTHAGADEHNAPRVPYNPSIEIRSFKAALTTPEGKRIEAKKNQILDVADFASYELYADSRAKVIFLDGVVPGAIVEYSYEQQLSNLFFLPRRLFLQDDIPIVSKTVTVSAPAALGLRFNLRGTADYSRQASGEVVTQRWNVRDVPAFKGEASMPPMEDLLPRLTLLPDEIRYGDHRINSTTWDGIARWYRDLSEERMMPAPEVAAAARDLVSGAEDPLIKTRRLYEFAQSKVRYVAIELGIGGFQPHGNASIFKLRYGDCKDKATLLVAMLRAVGLRGYPVLIRTRDAGLLDREFPSPSFNHAIVAVSSAGGYLFMDPTSETAVFGDLPGNDQGVPVLVVREDGTGDLAQTPLFGPERNALRWTVEATLDPYGDLEGRSVMEASGQPQTDFAALAQELKPKEMEDALAQWTAWLSPGTVLIDHAITPATPEQRSLQIMARFKIPKFVTRTGGMEIVSPHLVRQPWLASLAAYGVRRTPVFFHTLMAESAAMRLTLPAGRTLKKVPAGKDWTAPGLTARTEYALETVDDRRVLIVRRSMAVSQREIAASDYPALRQALQGMLEDEARAVTLVSETTSSRISHAFPNSESPVTGR